MAVLSRITCERCGLGADVMHAPHDRPKVCHACHAAEAASERDQHFAELNALPLEERLRRIEEWIYDYRPQYVEPPRF